MDYYLISRKQFSVEECDSIISLHKRYPAVDGKLGEVRDGVDLFWIQGGLETNWIFSRLWQLAKSSQAEWNFDLLPPQGALQLSRYEVGGAYQWHMDLGPGSMAYRKLTIVVQLTPHPSSGSLEIFGIGCLHLDVGDIAIFPSYIMHRAAPVQDDVRWSLACWVLGPDVFR